MKINQIGVEKTTKRTLFFLWLSAISAIFLVFVVPPVLAHWPSLALLMPWLILLVFVPFAIVEVRRNKAQAAREKRALQAKHDAEDKAMFGKPLRELEL